MAYWVDEGAHRWAQIAQAGTAAAGLYWRCGSWVADEGTDGYVPSAIARMYGTAEWIARLVDVGLWTVEEDGFRDTRYLELNATEEEKAARRKAGAQRQARHYARLKRAADQGRNADMSPDASVTRTPSPAPLRGEGRVGAHRYADDGAGVCRVCGLIPAHGSHLRAVEAG